jgi:DNA-binding transcriptional LysR family regulator
LIDISYISIVELRHLRYFLAVADELHFGRAARRLHISQPPLSQQIRKLEDELRVELFKRTSRRVELTPAGTAFLNDVRKIMATVDDAIERARSVAAGEEGFLHVGFITMAMDSFLPGVLAEFARLHPGITLSLSETSTNDQLEAVRSGRLQAGFPRLYQHDLTGLNHEVVLREPYMLAIPEEHALASRPRITVPSLRGTNLILSPRPVQPRVCDRILASCREAGFVPSVMHEAMSKRSCLALVAAGLGVSLATESTLDAHRPGVTYRVLDGDWPPVEIAIVWADASASPGLDQLLEVVRRYARSAPGEIRTESKSAGTR